MSDERDEPGTDALSRSADIIGGALGTAVNKASQATDLAGSTAAEISEIAIITTERTRPARRAVKRTVKRAIKRARRVTKAASRRSTKRSAPKSKSAAKKAARSKKGSKKSAARKKR